MHVPKWESQILEQQASLSDAEVAQDAQSMIVSSDPAATRSTKMQDRCGVGQQRDRRWGRQQHPRQPQQAQLLAEVCDSVVLVSAPVRSYRGKAGSAGEGKSGLGEGLHNLS